MPKHKSVAGRKSVKTKKAVVRRAKPIYNSDDDIPDETAESFHKDEIDMFNDEVEESSDEAIGEELPEAKPALREAVYDFSDSEEEEEMEKRLKKIEASVRRKQKHSDSSESEEEDEEDLGRAKAWGKKRDDFYGADVSTKVDLGVSSEDEEAEAKMEEEEARLQQQKLLSEVDESDYYLFMDSATDPSSTTTAAKPTTEDPTPSSQLVSADIHNLSEKEKVKLLKQKHPEFINLVKDYKAQLTEFIDRVEPLIAAHKQGLIPDSNGMQLMMKKGMFLLRYCTCCEMYLLLVAEKVSLERHPVFEKLAQYKKIIDAIYEAEQKIKPQMEALLEKIRHGKLKHATVTPTKPKVDAPIETAATTAAATTAQLKADVPSRKKKSVVKIQESLKNRKKVSNPKKSMQSLLDDDDEEEEASEQTLNGGGEEAAKDDLLTGGEKEAMEFYNMVKRRRLAGNEQMDTGLNEGAEEEEGGTEVLEELGDDKRGVTEEMMKNRGLTAKRPKHLKNPRIKNKLKYQKKKKIHKTMVPNLLRETNRYSGEVSGIRAGRIRSVQLS